jgi:DNA invertase Pin-like site-specific DNA recombinase
MNYRQQRAALDAERNFEVRRMRALGSTYAEIARAVNIPYGSVYGILNPGYRQRRSDREKQQGSDTYGPEAA